MSSTTMRERQQVSKRLESKSSQLDKIVKPEEALAQVGLLPLFTVHEARYALETIKDTIPDGMEFEVIEPLARVIGWAEAGAYFASVSQRVPSVGNGVTGR